MSPPAADLDALIDATALEHTIFGVYVLGVFFLFIFKFFVVANEMGPRRTRLAAELHRKAFHIIGGCSICSIYFFGLQWHVLSRADLLAPPVSDSAAGGIVAPNAAGIFAAVTLVFWLVEALRLTFPAVQHLVLAVMGPIIRQRELARASGMAFFLPGALAVILAFPPRVAVLGLLFLSAGDAASSIGTAVGVIPIGKSSRRGEGSMAMFLVCVLLGTLVAVPLPVAIVAAAFATIAELLTEIIGVDDNLVVPLMGAMGLRLAVYPPPLMWLMSLVALAFVLSTAIGVAVSYVNRTSPPSIPPASDVPLVRASSTATVGGSIAHEAAPTADSTSRSRRTRLSAGN